MGKHPKEYIHNVARTIIGQIGGVSYSGIHGHSEADEANYANMLWQSHGADVVVALRKMGPQAHGKIVACGIGYNPPSGSTCYYEVNECRELAAAPEGSEALIYLAAYVVVAAIVDIIRANIDSSQQEKEDKERLAWLFGNETNHFGQTR